MFTKLKAGGSITNSNVGDKVTGSLSGATGIIGHVNGVNMYVHDVVGTFVHNDVITSEGDGTATFTVVG